LIHEKVDHKDAWMVISDLNGREIQRLAAPMKVGLNEILYTHGYNAVGTYVYSLVVDGKVIQSRRMVFAN
jgi:hypothetical protein